MMTVEQIKAYYYKRVVELAHLSTDTFRPLENYTFIITNDKPSILGSCHYNDMSIRLNKNILPKMNDEEIKDTINHEISHALLGPGFQHGSEWKRMARICGAIPKASHTLESTKQEIMQETASRKYKVFMKRGNILSFLMFSDNEVTERTYIPGRKRETYGKLVGMENWDGKPEYTVKPEPVVEPEVVEPKPIVNLPVVISQPKPAVKPARKPVKPAPAVILLPAPKPEKPVEPKPFVPTPVIKVKPVQPKPVVEPAPAADKPEKPQAPAKFRTRSGLPIKYVPTKKCQQAWLDGYNTAETFAQRMFELGAKPATIATYLTDCVRYFDLDEDIAIHGKRTLNAAQITALVM